MSKGTKALIPLPSFDPMTLKLSARVQLPNCCNFPMQYSTTNSPWYDGGSLTKQQLFTTSGNLFSVAWIGALRLMITGFYLGVPVFFTLDLAWATLWVRATTVISHRKDFVSQTWSLTHTIFPSLLLLQKLPYCTRCPINYGLAIHCAHFRDGSSGKLGRHFDSKYFCNFGDFGDFLDAHLHTVGFCQKLGHIFWGLKKVI